MSKKLALVGIGKIAVDQHIPAISQSWDWELAATVSRQGRVDGVEHFFDFREMLSARPDIECVSLCLPPVPRFDYAVAALQAQRHVMLEKPPGATISECRALEAKAREVGVSIFATWHSREAAQVARARKWLADKKLKSAEIIWKEDVRRWHPGQKWIWEAGGLGVFDPGINAFSILTEILPDPVHVKNATLHFPENCDTPIAAEISFVHPAQAPITAEFDFLSQHDQIWTIAIETDSGQLCLEEGGAKLTINGEPQPDANQPMNTGSSDSHLLDSEYPRLYAKMAALIENREIEMDLAPIELVADAFLLGQRKTVEPFYE